MIRNVLGGPNGLLPSAHHSRAITESSLFFFPLVFLFPWCFSSLGFPWCVFECSLLFYRVRRVRTVRKSLMFLRFSLVLSKRARKIGTAFWKNPIFTGRNISVIRAGMRRVTKIQITSCPIKKEFWRLPASVICAGEVPARKSFLSLHVFLMILTLDVLNCGSLFAMTRTATGSQQFQIARFESQGQKPFESLLRLYLEPLRGKSASEKVTERTSENIWKNSENLWKPLKTSENPPSQRPSQRLSQRQISLSEALGPVAPIHLRAP